MDKAIKLLNDHLNETCKSLARLKTDDRIKYKKLIDVFEEEKQSYTNAIKILTTYVETGENTCNLHFVVVSDCDCGFTTLNENEKVCKLHCAVRKEEWEQ